MIDRRDLGSWLEGPPRDPSRGQPGERLGLPPDGPGSLAPIGRRIAALLIDGVLSQIVASALLGYHQGAGGVDAFKPLLVVFVLNVVLVGTWGSTIGHRFLGLRVERAPRGYAGPVRGLVRTILLCLAIPPFVVDRDGRGLHDRLAGTVLLRT